MKVFVAGATGETGKRIVQELTKRQISVTALVRDLNKAKDLLPSEVELVEGDVLNIDSLRKGIAGSNIIISATGARPSLNFTEPFLVDYQGTKNLVDVAKTSGIEHFVMVSSLCVSKFLHPLNLFWLVLFWKQQAEYYLQKSGLIYTIVRPGGLKNEDNSESIVMSSADTLFEGRIPRQKVAQVCVEALFQPVAKNKIVEIVTNPQASTKTWAELFSSII